MAPPAAPIAAPASAPITPAFTTSWTLSFVFATDAACWLHAATTLCGGAAGAGTAGAGEGAGATGARLATAARGATAGFACAGVLFAAGRAWRSGSEPIQFATTSPVTRATTTARASPIVVSFQGFQVPSVMVFLPPRASVQQHPCQSLRTKGPMPRAFAPTQLVAGIARSGKSCTLRESSTRPLEVTPAG